MPCQLTFLVLVWTLIRCAHDSLQNLLHFMTFSKINGRCQMSAPTCGDVEWDFHTHKKGLRFYASYLMSQMLKRNAVFNLKENTVQYLCAPVDAKIQMTWTRPLFISCSKPVFVMIKEVKAAKSITSNRSFISLGFTLPGPFCQEEQTVLTFYRGSLLQTRMRESVSSQC